MVALNGNPTTAGSAFAAVYAAALANDGSFDNIAPGVDFFGKLDQVGNYNRSNPNVDAIARGETPISIEWDFLNLEHINQLRGSSVTWKVSPHPAAARLWEEYLAGPEGQNLRLVDYARPVLMAYMAKKGTLDTSLASKLPTVEGTPVFPTESQLKQAQQYVQKNWATAVPPK